MQDPLVTKRIAELDPTYRAFLFSGMPQIIAGTFSETYTLNEEQDAVLENGFVLYLLFFFTRTELASFIATELPIPKKDASLMSEAMHIALPEDIRTMHEVTAESLSNNDIGETAETIMSEIAKTEAVLETISTPPSTSPKPPVQSIRTMATDSQVGYHSTQEATHQSDQSNLLQK